MQQLAIRTSSKYEHGDAVEAGILDEEEAPLFDWPVGCL